MWDLMRIAAAATAMAAALPAAALPAAAQGVAIEAPGPQGALAGAFVDAGKDAPVVLIWPGSGPTDRDGNSRLGITAGTLRMIAEGLAGEGISSVRIDKRGMYGSKAAVASANDASMDLYADDVAAWVKAIRARTGASCVWMLGHSEGGLVALTAGQRVPDLCGLVLVSAMGRRFGEVLRVQFMAIPDVAQRDALTAAVGALEAGKPIDVAKTHPIVGQVFSPAVQPFVIDTLARDPARLAASYRGPMMIVQGTRDLQVLKEDARLLKAAQPRAELRIVPGMNHVLKIVDSDDRAANLATYVDPSLPLAPGLVAGIAAFVKAPRR